MSPDELAETRRTGRVQEGGGGQTRVADPANPDTTRGATVNGQQANMVLDLRVQPGGSNAASSLIEFGRRLGVDVIIKEF